MPSAALHEDLVRAERKLDQIAPLGAEAQRNH